MALLISGKTRCAVCGEVIHAQDEVVMFAPGLFGPRSRPHRFDDASAHHRCLTGLDTGRQALRELKEFITDPVAYVRSRNEM
ncbi:hypothetical protein AB0B66_30225 [Catellatospora sp. NPDC049111]|uniref:hypothetical protein n=1 Tax=Catellatospora sp. NPDC049111 TaxID=3155271 RepID=UPI0034074C6E